MVELLSLLMKFVGNMPQNILVDKETIICEIKTHKLKWMHISVRTMILTTKHAHKMPTYYILIHFESLNFDFAMHLLCRCHCTPSSYQISGLILINAVVEKIKHHHHHHNNNNNNHNNNNNNHHHHHNHHNTTSFRYFFQEATLDTHNFRDSRGTSTVM